MTEGVRPSGSAEPCEWRWKSSIPASGSGIEFWGRCSGSGAELFVVSRDRLSKAMKVCCCRWDRFGIRPDDFFCSADKGSLRIHDRNTEPLPDNVWIVRSPSNQPISRASISHRDPLVARRTRVAAVIALCIVALQAATRSWRRRRRRGRVHAANSRARHPRRTTRSR